MAEPLDTLLKVIKQMTDTQLSEVFVGAQKLTKEQQELVEFVFWLCYTTETDLELVITTAWEKSSTLFQDDSGKLAEKMIIDTLKGYRIDKEDIQEYLDSLTGLGTEHKKNIADFVGRNYSPKRIFTSVTELPFFVDKIKVYEAMMGKSERTSLLYKINDIRNALSHHRLDDLKYKGRSLMLREAKEEIVLDYFRTSQEVEDRDITKSALWKELDEPTREIIKRKLAE